MPRPRTELPHEVQTLAKRLEFYRNSPHRPRRLPESFWTQAAGLARQHGAGLVQQALRLNYGDLKRRMEVSPSPKSAPVHPSAPHSPAFVELGLSALSTQAGAGTTLELQDQSGRKLTIRLCGGSSGDLAAVARAVWGSTP